MMEMKELYEKVAADPALQKQVTEILADAAEKGTEATEAALLAFAREQGFTVTIEEARAFFEGLETAHELGEGELDMVAGGKKNGHLVGMLALASIGTFGIACMVASIGAAVNNLGNCVDY